jgi:hypothetical protein
MYHDEDNLLWEVYCPMLKIYPPHVVKVFANTKEEAVRTWNLQGGKR